MPRWYDSEEYSQIKSSIQFFKKLPDEFLTIVAEGVVKVAEKEFTQKELKAVGVEKILALHKSKNKTREEDQNKHLHRSINYLVILPERKRQHLGKHMHHLCNHVIQYFKLCQDASREPNKDEVATMVGEYVKSGHQDVLLFLEKLREDFLVGLETRFIHMGQGADLRIGTKTQHR